MSLRTLVATATMTVYVVIGDHACNNTADLKIYDVIKNNISAVQKDCILNGAPGADWTHHCLKEFMESTEKGEACMSDCVNKRTHLSATCSACFGTISACVYKNCVMNCLDATSPGCISCTKQYCLSDFTTCTGFENLPPAAVASYNQFLIGDEITKPNPVSADLQVIAVGDHACNNTADLKIYDVIKNNISAVQKDCIMNGAPGADWTHHCLREFMESTEKGEACMSDCVNKRTHLSATCSACFGTISACVYKNCVMNCLDATSPGCISCTQQYCLSDFTTCTGFDHLPPAEAVSYNMLLI